MPLIRKISMKVILLKINKEVMTICLMLELVINEMHFIVKITCLSKKMIRRCILLLANTQK